MIKKDIPIWKPNEYHFPRDYGFMPFFRCYLHEQSDRLPGIVLVPGGAYRFVSPTEADPVASKFYQMGYQVFVVTYTTNFLGLAPVHEQASLDIARVIRILRKKSQQFGINPNQIALCGFSAGGHASASVGVHFSVLADPSSAYTKISPRPDAMILCYPVITSNPEYTHLESMQMLMGKNPTADEIRYHATELHVSKSTPPTFLWHTVTDNAVPVRNSIAFADALAHHGVPVSLHLFSSGDHGLSTADGSYEITEENQYTHLQLQKLEEAIREGILPKKEIENAESGLQELNNRLHKMLHTPSPCPTNTEVSQWISLADTWLTQYFS